MARWFRWGLSVAGPFGCGCLTSRTMLRFHFPLIEPCVRIFAHGSPTGFSLQHTMALSRIGRDSENIAIFAGK